MLRHISLPGLLMIVLISAIVTACLPTVIQAGCAFFISLAVAALNWKAVQGKTGNILKANFFILFIWLVTPLTARGEILLQWHFLHISREGLLLCVLITLKSEAILLLITALLGNRTMYDLGAAMAALKCPSKLVWLFLLMERNVYLIKQEWQRLSSAVKLRAFQPRSDLYTYSVYAAMFGILLMHAFDKGKTRYEAMLLSGYDGKLPFQKNWHPGREDYLAIFATLSVCAGLMALGTFCV